jgi:hypothetical protein
MSLPICVIITSTDCTHCRNLKSSGDFSREGKINKEISMEGFQWNANSLSRLITADENVTYDSKSKFRVYEYELYTMRNPSHEGVKSFTVFTFEIKKNRAYVIRKTFQRDSQAGDSIIYILDKKEGIKAEGSYNALVRSVFPKLYNYAIQFPNALFFSAEEWEKSIKDPNISPYGRSATLNVSLAIDRITNKPNTWVAVSADHTRQPYKKNYITYASYLLENIDMLLPPKNTIKDETKPKINFKRTIVYGVRY